MTDETQGAAVEDAGEADTSTMSITIQGFDFDVGRPYAVGHTVNENEANALNQTRAENIRNNLASRIKREAEIRKVAVPELDLDAGTGEDGSGPSLNAQAAEYIAAYEFGARQASTREPVDPVARMARKIAKEVIAEALKSSKVAKKDLTDEQYEGMVDTYAADPAIQKEAKRRVTEQSKIGAAALEALGLPGVASA